MLLVEKTSIFIFTDCFSIINTDAAWMFLLGCKLAFKVRIISTRFVFFSLCSQWKTFCTSGGKQTAIFSWAEWKKLELLNINQWGLRGHGCWCLSCNNHFKIRLSAVGMRGCKQEITGGHGVSPLLSDTVAMNGWKPCWTPWRPAPTLR